MRRLEDVDGIETPWQKEMQVLPLRRSFCADCDEPITGAPVLREYWTGRLNTIRAWLTFCSSMCEENDRVDGSERW